MNPGKSNPSELCRTTDQLDLHLADAGRQLKEFLGAQLALVDAYIKEVVNHLAEFFAEVFTFIDDQMADARFTVEDAKRRIDRNATQMVYEACEKCAAAGVEGLEALFPGGQVGPMEPVPPRKRVRAGAEKGGLPGVPVADQVGREPVPGADGAPPGPFVLDAVGRAVGEIRRPGGAEAVAGGPVIELLAAERGAGPGAVPGPAPGGAAPAGPAERPAPAVNGAGLFDRERPDPALPEETDWIAGYADFQEGKEPAPEPDDAPPASAGNGQTAGSSATEPPARPARRGPGPTPGWHEPDPSYRLDDHCERLGRLREALVDLGEAVLSDFRTSKGSKIESLRYHLYAAARIVYVADKEKKEARDDLMHLVNYVHDKGGLKELADLLASSTRQAEGDAQKLQATVLFLESLSSFTLQSSGSWGNAYVEGWDDSSATELDANLLKRFGFGRSAELRKNRHGEKNHNGSFSLLYTARIIVVPLLELARQFAEWANTTVFPTLAEIHATYLRGYISLETLHCYWQMMGAIPSVLEPVLQAGSATLNVNEAVAARRRELISEEDMQSRIRGQGVLKAEDAELFFKLSEAYPGISDVIRFLVRDAGDEALVKEFQMDFQFDQKWSQELAKYGKAQGITDQIARYYWRAHWQLPSPHMAYEMVRRLRQDSVPAVDPQLVTEASHVQKLLEQDDWLPWWIPRLLAISYAPLTRTDAQRMYMTGVLSAEELVSAFQDIGYTKTDAVRLTSFTGVRRRDFLARSRPARLYARGALSREQLGRQLAQWKVSAEELADLVERLDAEIKASTNRACFTAIKRRYLSGGLDREGARSALVKYGSPNEQAVQLVTAWTCELASREKPVAATTLCKWFQANLISLGDFRERLGRLGYTAVDTGRIVQMCQEQGVQRIRKQQNAAEGQKERDTKRLEAIRRREAELAFRGEERARKRAERAKQAEERWSQKRREAAMKAMSATGDSLEGAINWIDEILGDLLADTLISEQQARAIMLDAGREAGWTDLARWEKLAKALAEAESEEPIESNQPAVGTPAIPGS